MDKKRFKEVTDASSIVNQCTKAELASQLNQCIQLAIEHYIEHRDSGYLNKGVNSLSVSERRQIASDLQDMLGLHFDRQKKSFRRIKGKEDSFDPEQLKKYAPFTKYTLSVTDGGYINIDSPLAPSELYNFIADSLVLARGQFSKEQLDDLAQIIERASSKKEKVETREWANNTTS